MDQSHIQENIDKGEGDERRGIYKGTVKRLTICLQSIKETIIALPPSQIPLATLTGFVITLAFKILFPPSLLWEKST